MAAGTVATAGTTGGAAANAVEATSPAAATMTHSSPSLAQRQALDNVDTTHPTTPYLYHLAEFRIGECDEPSAVAPGGRLDRLG